MEIYCADCGCLVNQGVRIVPCDTDGYCCLGLALAAPMETAAARIRTAFNARDVDTFRSLLAEGATWGDDPGEPSYCHSRDDIVAHLERLLDEGVDATVVEAIPGQQGVACVLAVEWPEREAGRPERQTIYQTYLVTDGKVSEIRGHDDRTSAIAAISN